MSVFDQSNFKNCAVGLSSANTPDDALMAWLCLAGNHSELSAIVGLPEYDRVLQPKQKIIDSPVYKKYLVNYFTPDNLFFISDELLINTINNKEVKIPVDYTLSFDTNLASYIKTIIQGGNLGDARNEIITVLDQLLVDDINFDHSFYLAENTKQVYSQVFRLRESATPFEFWKNLNKKFRWNLVSLELFRGIDCERYKNSSAGPKSIFSFRDAVRNSVRSAFKYYTSESGKLNTIKLLKFQRVILLYLLGMYNIQFSSKKGAKAKIAEFFYYIQHTVGAYFDREVVAVHKYFVDRKQTPFLNQVNLGGIPKRFLKSIDNIAWDMAAPRFMEELIGTGGEGQFFAPFFISFDKELRDMLNSFLIKGVVIDQNTKAVVPIPKVNTYDYFVESGCESTLDWFFSEDCTTQRQKNRLDELRDINFAILNEYRKLRKLYNTPKNSKSRKQR